MILPFYHQQSAGPFFKDSSCLGKRRRDKQHKFSFYGQKNKVSAIDEPAFRKLYFGEKTFTPFGGFQPDPSRHWKDGKETVELHI